MADNIIILAKRETGFVIVPKSILDDHRLSAKAKGVLAYLIGKPAGWKLRVQDIRNHFRDGEKAVRSALKELRVAGYAELMKIRAPDGTVKEWLWKISDSPIFQPDACFPHVDKRHSSKKDGSKKRKPKKTPLFIGVPDTRPQSLKDR